MHPTLAQVQQWLADYGNVEQHLLFDIAFYLHPITRGDLKAARAMGGDDASTEEYICAFGTLWPQAFDFQSAEYPAGLASQVAAHILELSGMTPASGESLFRHWQDQVFSETERRDLLILRAFPHFTFAALDALSGDDYYHYLALADFLLRTEIMTTNSADMSPDEFVTSLLCSKEDLIARLEQHERALQQDQGAPPGAGPPAPRTGPPVDPKLLREAQSRLAQLP